MLGLFLLSLLPSTLAAPLLLGIHFGSGSGSLPTLELPYATYKAYSYDVTDDYYTFKNIRFAAPPIGNLRWAKPEKPLVETGVQDGSIGYQCPQALPENLSFAYPFLAALEPYSEDCLFLDIMVPGKAVRGEVKDLPVLFWLFGGGYVLGSKSFFLYDGNPLLKSADNNLIYVAPNYRLGGFGFLNGPVVEAQGTPNAAFWDQRAALKWVQDYIHLIGGSKSAVTAMGESAGAGSIMHHLIGNSGKLDPMFQRAIMQSPAFEPQYSPVKLQEQYARFESLAGCAGKGLTCLRGKTTAELQEANLEVVGSSQYGTFGFGPAVDNQFIKNLPGIEMENGNYWKDVSVLFGHTSNEGIIFADPSKIFNSQIDSLLKSNFPLMTTANFNALQKLYPEPSLFGPFLTNYDRLANIIGNWVVTCNTRYIAKAYAGKVWGYQFSVPPGVHAIDLIFTFWRTDLNIGRIFQLDFDLNFITQKNLATGFQSYLTSFVRSGNPNTYRQKDSIPRTVEMPLATVGNYVKILDVGLFSFTVQDDPNVEKNRCAFWQAGAWTGR